MSLITYCSSSNRDAFWGSFLYMFGMTVSFYTLKFLLGFFWKRFSGEFPTALFFAYSVMSLVCGIGSYILYFWNKKNVFSSLLCALPASGMLAEAIACSIVLRKETNTYVPSIQGREVPSVLFGAFSECATISP